MGTGTGTLSAPGLQLALRLPERDVDIALEVPAGQTLALLGANGAGKSTVLEVAAGLLAPYDGEVVLGGRTLTRVEQGRRRALVAPYERGVGLLAQEPRLFPHLDATGNVAFGPRSRGASRRTARSTASDWLARVGVAEQAQHRPAALSGGQAQRVALARALAADPRLLLLDEPLAALDVDVTGQVRLLLRHVLAGRTAVIATHDVLDALLLADSVAVLEAGRVVEQGPTREVLSRPRSRFGARIAGLNLVSGSWEAVRGPRGAAASTAALRTAAGTLVQGRVSDPRDGAESPGGPSAPAAVAVFRPAAVAVHPVHTGATAVEVASPRNSFEVTVVALEPHGDLVRVRGDLAGATTAGAASSLHADITPGAVAELALAPGQAARFVVKAAEVELYPA